jgi:hypothetical protein
MLSMEVLRRDRSGEPHHPGPLSGSPIWEGHGAPVSNHQNRPSVPQLSPEYKREMITVAKWFAIGLACLFAAFLPLSVMRALSWPEDVNIATALALATFIPCFAAITVGFVHMGRANRIQDEYRISNNIHSDNTIVEFIASHPYWFGVIILAVSLCITVLRFVLFS